jgi:hypothetical protein
VSRSSDCVLQFVSTMNDFQERGTSMNQETPERSACSDNNALARQCLQRISEIASRGARSQDPQQIGYALQELTQVLFERTGSDDRVFEPVPPSEIRDLEGLCVELDFVNCSAQDLMAGNPQNWVV